MVEGVHTGMGTASLILGIIGIIIVWIPLANFAALPMGIIATILGAKSYFNKNLKDTYGLAGFILGIITTVFGALIMVSLLVYIFVSGMM